MFRGFMPALTLIVFGMGLGLGVAWSRGLIPLTYVPAKSGSLSVEVAQREELPPPNRGDEKSSDSTPNDPEIFEQQSEPEPGNTATMAIRTLDPPDRPQSAATFREPELRRTSDVKEQSTSSDEQPSVPARVRVRGQNAVQLDSEAGIEEEPPKQPRDRQVKVATQQDAASDLRETVRESPRESVRKSKAPASLRDQLTAAEEKLADGETLAAHRELSELYWHHKDFRPQLQEIIDSTAKAIFFQSKPHYVDPYVIQEGDRLEVIAKKYQLSWEYLTKLNRIEPRRIQIGQKLKVIKGPFGAVVDLQEFALTIHLQGYYVKRYQVGIGKDGSSPIGKFPVLNKVENPPYTGPNGKVIAADDPMNPLGERWIDLGDSYGIHGTIDPKSIGKAESRGCIRLRDNEIIEVYDFLVKGSEVVIRK